VVCAEGLQEAVTGNNCNAHEVDCVSNVMEVMMLTARKAYKKSSKAHLKDYHNKVNAFMKLTVHKGNRFI
jgi:phosphoglycerate-specific signal transduction histidine kinase